MSWPYFVSPWLNVAQTFQKDGKEQNFRSNVKVIADCKILDLALCFILLALSALYIIHIHYPYYACWMKDA